MREYFHGPPKDILKKSESYSLTNDDIERETGFQPIAYDQLASIQTIDELLEKGKNDAIIILYLSSWNSGHYTLLYRNQNVIHFFDSYGLKEDVELKYMPFYLNEGGQPHLTRLLNSARQQGYLIDHNPYQLQAKKTDTTTCGIWCVTRLRFRKLSHQVFYKIFTDNKMKIASDDILVLMNYMSFYYNIL